MLQATSRSPMTTMLGLKMILMVELLEYCPSDCLDMEAQDFILNTRDGKIGEEKNRRANKLKNKLDLNFHA